MSTFWAAVVGGLLVLRHWEVWVAAFFYVLPLLAGYAALDHVTDRQQGGGCITMVVGIHVLAQLDLWAP